MSSSRGAHPIPAPGRRSSPAPHGRYPQNRMAFSRASLTARTQWDLRARASLASCAALLLPLFAAADSQLQLRSGSGATSAAAHVTFKIVIPTVLSLDMAQDPERAHGGLTAEIFSNAHSVALAAALRSSEESRGTLLLNSAARKALAQKAACAPGSPRGSVSANAPHDVEPFPAVLVCTACTP